MTEEEEKELVEALQLMAAAKKKLEKLLKKK